jgi:hypothetical protein
MKKFHRFCILIFIVAIGSSCKTADNNTEVSRFVSDVFSINPDELTGSDPIVRISNYASQKADKMISIDKTNIAEAMLEASKYKNSVLVVGNHTLIRIKKFDDCQKSTAWAANMPKGTALVRKNGAFEKHSDYINNLMGRPDGQSRMLYLFR